MLFLPLLLQCVFIQYHLISQAIGTFPVKSRMYRSMCVCHIFVISLKSFCLYLPQNMQVLCASTTISVDLSDFFLKWMIALIEKHIRSYFSLLTPLYDMNLDNKGKNTHCIFINLCLGVYTALNHTCLWLKDL